MCFSCDKTVQHINFKHYMVPKVICVLSSCHKTMMLRNFKSKNSVVVQRVSCSKITNASSSFARCKTVILLDMKLSMLS